MTIIRRARAAALAALLPAAASAVELSPIPETRVPARTLAWDDCVKIALDRNPDLASALRFKDQSRASYYQSFNGVMPNVVVANSYSSGSGTAGRAGYQASAVASVDLFNMGKISSIRSASASYEQAQASLRQVSANVRFSLRSAFANVLLAEMDVDVARKILDIRRVGAEMVTLRYQSGHEYKGNMMNAGAQQLQAEASLAQARRAQRSTRRAFARQLGLDDFEEVSATGTLAAAAAPPPPADVFALLSGRPDVQVQEAIVRGANVSVTSAESPLFPSLSATYSRTRGTAGSEFPAAPYAWSAGATLSYPLFGGGPTGTYFAVQASKRGLEKAQEDLRTTRDAAVADLETAWASYANAVDQARVQRLTLESSRQRNDEADVRYASGLLTFDNWTVIVSQRVSDELSAVQSLHDAVVAQAAWEKALGKILGE